MLGGPAETKPLVEPLGPEVGLLRAQSYTTRALLPHRVYCQTEGFESIAAALLVGNDRDPIEVSPA